MVEQTVLKSHRAPLLSRVQQGPPTLVCNAPKFVRWESGNQLTYGNDAEVRPGVSPSPLLRLAQAVALQDPHGNASARKKI